MQNETRYISPTDIVFILFCPGLGLLYYACTLIDIPVPFHTAGYMATGLGVAGLFSELFRTDRLKTSFFYLTTLISTLLLTFLLFQYATAPLKHFFEILPYMMQARPVIFTALAALWLNRFGLPSASTISRSATVLAVISICVFLLQIFNVIPFGPPGGVLGSSIISTSLLCGFSATLDRQSETKLEQTLIILGIFCTLNRNTSIIAAMICFLFGEQKASYKLTVALGFLFFTYFSIVSQNMTFLNRTDIPTYWIWAAGISLISQAPHILLVGLPLSLPLPFNIPTTLWQVWGNQQQVWTDFGVFLFNIRPFWLSAVLSWGIPGLTVCVAILTFLGRRCSSKFCHGLIFSVIIAATFDPVFNSPAEAFILCTSFLTAFTKADSSQTEFEFS